MSDITTVPSSASAQMPAPVTAPTLAFSAHEQVIQPTRGWIGVNWRELIDGRELLYFLIWRDLKVRYKQAILGVAWVVIQPIMNMVMYTLVFGNAAGLNKRLPGHEHEYSVFVYAALLPWQLFSYSLSSGGMSLVNQQNIVKKIYFPRLFIPTAAVGGAIVDMGISFLMVILLVVWKHIPFSPMLLMLPMFLALGLLNSLGAAYLLSGLTVKYRDFRFIIPFLSQVLMFASFVAFPPALVDGSRWKWLLYCNPMYGVVAGFRRCILSDFSNKDLGFDWSYVISSLVGGLILFIVGIFIFRRTERTFADIA
jgi:lipopolysaccharide transport system permease protein